MRHHTLYLGQAERREGRRPFHKLFHWVQLGPEIGTPSLWGFITLVDAQLQHGFPVPETFKAFTPKLTPIIQC